MSPPQPAPLDGPFPLDFGRYDLLRPVGSGGMGRVFRAWDKWLEREVALKVPHPHLIDNPGVRQRFYREARAASRLCHPNLCQVYDIGLHADHHYLTMRFVQGRPLTRPPLPDAEADIVRLLHCLALALAEAHRLNVLHRDLKLSNILLTADGEPVVVDFGIALRTDIVHEWRTEAGPPPGTLTHMCPEQLDSQGEAPPDQACDVYGLGVVMYQLLTGGAVPFDGADRAEVRRRMRQGPPRPSAHRPGIAPRLEEVCLRALAVNAAERYPTMLAFAAALADFLAGPPARVRPKTRPTRLHIAFARMGENAPDELRHCAYLDVGNDLRPGVIDHHHLTASPDSTASLVLAHPELLEQVIDPQRPADAPFTLFLHQPPDLDCVVAAYLAKEFLLHGTFPPGSAELANYVNKVDQGYFGLNPAAPFTLYSGCMVLLHRARERLDLLKQQGATDPQPVWRDHVERAMDLVDYVRGRMLQQDVPVTGLDAFDCPGMFTAADRELVLSDLDRYRRKLANSACQARRYRLRLPSLYGGTVEVPALFVRHVQDIYDEDRVLFFKDWARQDGNVALSVFMEAGPGQRRSCIVSVTPASGASLCGLGDRLDECEARRRKEIFQGIDDRVIDPQTGQPRPPRRGGYRNADPWYDGRSHGFSIIDAPREGTRLTADEIDAVVLAFGDAREMAG